VTDEKRTLHITNNDAAVAKDPFSSAALSNMCVDYPRLYILVSKQLKVKLGVLYVDFSKLLLGIGDRGSLPLRKVGTRSVPPPA